MPFFHRALPLKTTNEFAGSEYTDHPLVASNSLFKNGFTLDDYSLNLDKAVSSKDDLPNSNLLSGLFSDNTPISGGKYNLFKGETKLGTVYIYQKSNMKGSNNLLIGNLYRYIEVASDNSVKKSEIEGELGSDIVLTVVNGSATIAFENYFNSDSFLRQLQGYTILVNKQKYGILTFYKTPVFHESNNHPEIDNTSKELIFIYTLAMYQEWIQSSNK